MVGHHISSSTYPIIMLTNERLVVVGSITCVHWLPLLWDIWITIWLGDYMVAYHELSPTSGRNEIPDLTKSITGVKCLEFLVMIGVLA